MLDRKNIALLDEHPARPDGAPHALDDIRVIDFSHFVAGPIATLLLADFGADVIKVESPSGGDLFRHYPPQDASLESQGAPYLWANRNKRSIALDLKTPDGLALAREMIAGADVLVENFSTGVMQRLGLDYESCARINPRLVYCSISAYGRQGEFSDRVGFDTIVQAESGFMSLNGEADGEGFRTTATVMDIGTGLMASNGILMALHSRERTGRGQHVETALFDTGLTMVGYGAMQHLFSGREPRRSGNTSLDSAPSAVFRAQDTSFLLTCSNDRLFQKLCADVIGMPQLADDPDFRTSAARLAHRERLTALLAEVFARHPWAHWRDLCRSASVPVAEVRSLPGALKSPEARARGLVTRIPHPVAGWIPNIALPIRMTATPAAFPSPAPSLGQHTEQVLSELAAGRAAP